LTDYVQNSIARAGSGKIRTFNLVRSLLNSLAQLASQPHAISPFSLYRSGATRIPDEDRALIYHEMENMLLLCQQSRAHLKIKPTTMPTQAAAHQLSVASAVWIHDRFRDAFLWRALLWENPVAVPSAMRCSDVSKLYCACSRVTCIDGGGMLSKPVLEWMERAYGAHVTEPATALCELNVTLVDSSTIVRFLKWPEGHVLIAAGCCLLSHETSSRSDWTFRVEAILCNTSSSKAT
jgi:hypothetical protein